ncbi:MAG TPA: sugar transferase [Bacillota bacterium]|jgi:undecaprenyl phosphate N,N'-diacetylbacillosamine 1-phosphate transferase|nr:sugar transferase [Bacillota bacterium]
MYKKHFKRPLDFLMALIGLVVLSPLMLAIAIMVSVKLGRPVIFKQLRPGLNERIFTLYKFRTMTDECDENGELLPDEQRLTPFGTWLRSTSLDELPELWNILKGDMSFVGPRPLLVEYLPLYNEQQRRRHIVRPGLTGLAQVSGRNAVSWEEKFLLDIEYINNITFWGDLAILAKTVLAVLRREGINSPACATAEVFQPAHHAGEK